MLFDIEVTIQVKSRWLFSAFLKYVLNLTKGKFECLQPLAFVSVSEKNKYVLLYFFVSVSEKNRKWALFLKMDSCWLSWWVQKWLQRLGSQLQRLGSHHVDCSSFSVLFENKHTKNKKTCLSFSEAETKRKNKIYLFPK